ncbi:MAG TPA: hypothetical protein VK786_01535, partial [bacterium]|nr:hypothetical protein [bacterium]
HGYNFPQGLGFNQAVGDLRGIADDELKLAPVRPMLRGHLGLAYDYDRRTVYAVETDSDRIMAYRVLDKRKFVDFGGAIMPVFDYAPEKPLGVKRNVVVGGSLCFVADSKEADRLFPKQLEQYWNLFNHLNGVPEQEEVVFDGMNMGYMAGGGLSYALGYPGIWAKVHADRVILTVTYFDVLREALAFLKAATPGDRAPARVDEEWVTTDWASRDQATGPLGMALKKSLLAKTMGLCPGSTVTKQGGLYYAADANTQRLLADPELRAEILAIYERRVDAFLKQAKQEGCGVVAALLPVRNQLTNTEITGGGEDPDSGLTPPVIDDALRAIFESRGVPFYNL